MPTMCVPDLKAQILNAKSGVSEILIHVVFNFLEPFIKWFADCTHCNQEGPFPTKKTCLVSMIWSHLQQTLCVDQSKYWCCRLWRRLLSSAFNCCQLLSLATADQLDQYPQVPVPLSRTFRESQHLLRCQFFRCAGSNALMTSADDSR